MSLRRPRSSCPCCATLRVIVTCVPVQNEQKDFDDRDFVPEQLEERGKYEDSAGLVDSRRSNTRNRSAGRSNGENKREGARKRRRREAAEETRSWIFSGGHVHPSFLRWDTDLKKKKEGRKDINPNKEPGSNALVSAAFP